MAKKANPIKAPVAVKATPTKVATKAAVKVAPPSIVARATPIKFATKAATKTATVVKKKVEAVNPTEPVIVNSQFAEDPFYFEPSLDVVEAPILSGTTPMSESFGESITKKVSHERENGKVLGQITAQAIDYINNVSASGSSEAKKAINAFKEALELGIAAVK